MARRSKKKGNNRRGRRKDGFASLFEKDNHAHLKNLRVSFQYEPFRIPFTEINNRHYKPDFFLENGIIIETKGRFEPADRKKHLLIREQYPSIDVRFVFQKPYNSIYNGSKTTYADWCDNNGFKWHERIVPRHWVTEDPNEDSLRCLRNLGLIK